MSVEFLIEKIKSATSECAHEGRMRSDSERTLSSRADGLCRSTSTRWTLAEPLSAAYGQKDPLIEYKNEALPMFAAYGDIKAQPPNV